MITQKEPQKAATARISTIDRKQRKNRLQEIGREAAARRGAKNFSDYVRGLLILDALSLGLSLKGVKIPGWLTAGKHIRITHTLTEKGEAHYRPYTEGRIAPNTNPPSTSQVIEFPGKVG